MSELEKLHKEVAGLERKHADLTTNLDAARQRREELESQRTELLIKVAEGSDSARRDLRGMDNDQQVVSADERAYGDAAAIVAKQLKDAKAQLAHLEAVADAERLEAEIASFGVLDQELQAALNVVAAKRRALDSAIRAVGEQLGAKDEKRWGNWGEAIRAQLTRACFFALEDMARDKPPRATFSEAVALDLRRAAAELKFMATGRVMPAQRDEKQFRVLTNIPGLRDVDARPKDVVALDPDDSETKRLLREQSIELVAGGAEQTVEVAGLKR